MIDLALVLGFVAYAIGAGWRARRQASQGLTDYFLAGRTVKGWRAGLSMAATQYAADTPLLATGLVATGGLFVLWRFWIYGFGYLLLGLLFAEQWRRARVLTDAELTEIRYSGRGVLALRTLKAVYYGTVVNCFFLAMVLIAAVRIAEVFLPWHTWLPEGLYATLLSGVSTVGFSLGVSITGLDPAVTATNGLLSIGLIVVFVLLYATTGGLRGVVATDVLQFAFAMVGTVAYAVLVVQEVGGLGQIGERLTELYGAAQREAFLALLPAEGRAVLPFLVILGLQGLFWVSSDGTGYLAQRAMACRSDHDARLAGIVFSWAQILGRSLVWLVISVGLLVLYPFTPAAAAADGFAAAREVTFVLGIQDLMPPGLKGIMLVGLLAALASTVDTHLNWGAAYWSNDLYDRLYCRALRKQEPDPRTLVRVARLSNSVILLLALTVMVNLGSIQNTWFVSLVFGAGIGGVLMLRWLWSRITIFSEVAAIVVSLVAAPFILTLVEAEWARLTWMVGLSTGAAIGITFVTRPTEAGVLQAYGARVRPLGWWPRGAPSPAASLRGFWLRLRLASWMTASLFLALIGGTRLLVPVPDTSPWVGWGCLALAAGLAPLWWKAFHARTFEGPALNQEARRPD
ncbi:MAG: sodium:solute symporter family protein [Bacteroidota bacterium]